MNQDKLQQFLSQKIVTIPLFLFQNMNKFSLSAEELKSVADNKSRAQAIENINSEFFQGVMSPSWYGDIDLWFSKYGFDEEECLSHELAYILTGKKYPNWKARKEGLCNCVNIVDIGAFNTCGHFCKYCYANFNEEMVPENMGKHDSNSSLLIGHLEPSDKIKVSAKIINDYLLYCFSWRNIIIIY